MRAADVTILTRTLGRPCLADAAELFHALVHTCALLQFDFTGLEG